MRVSHILAVCAVSVFAVSSTAAHADHRHRHRHHGNGAAVGAALGAGVFLGALAASSANAREDVYIEAAPPPPPPPRVIYRDRGEEANEAIAACRRGLLDAARSYGAFDADIGDIYEVRETPYGHRVRAEITIDYPRYSRTSNVTCETEDGLLVSARSDY